MTPRINSQNLVKYIYIETRFLLKSSDILFKNGLRICYLKKIIVGFSASEHLCPLLTIAISVWIL